MSRRTLSLLLLLVATGVLIIQRRAARSGDTTEGVSYRPSSAALIGATDRPQLVEFFHRA